jgi:hypothetical protein
MAFCDLSGCCYSFYQFNRIADAFSFIIVIKEIWPAVIKIFQMP